MAPSIKQEQAISVKPDFDIEKAQHFHVKPATDAPPVEAFPPICVFEDVVLETIQKQDQQTGESISKDQARCIESATCKLVYLVVLSSVVFLLAMAIIHELRK